jgi:hydroxymethylbilane synthase
LAKVARGDYDATLLAAAGLKRLGLFTAAMHLIDPAELIPAPAQGALGVECRAADREVVAVLSALDRPEARLTATAERAVLRELGATCATAAGAHSLLADGVLTIRADVMAVDSLERIHVEYAVACADVDGADAAGVHVAQEMLARGAAALVTMR